MTDRELLELAAKAAGIEVWFPRMADGQGGVIEPCHTTRNGQTEEWNPLTDDGDALRLAVKLGIAPIQDQKEKVCAAYWTDVHCVHSAYKGDPYAATRRAIVRASAAIGETL